MTVSGIGARITVLGGSGFLGTVVTRALLDRPVRLRVVTRGSCVLPERATAEVELRTAELTATAELADAVADADVVLFLAVNTDGRQDAAAEDAAERVNVGVPRALTEILRAGTRPRPVLVYAGSSSQVGMPPLGPITGAEPDRPRDAFDRQKHEAERIFMAADAAGLLRAVSLRLPMVVGHNGADRNGTKGMVAAMVRQALAGKPLTVWGDGSPKRDLLDVRDAASAVIAAIDNETALAGRHWLVGSGRGVALAEVLRAVADTVAEQTGAAPVPIVSVAPPAGVGAAELRDVVLDSSAFRAATGWAPGFDLRDSIRQTVRCLA